MTVAIPNSDLATVAGNNQVILKFREKDSFCKKICHSMNRECEKKLLGLISATWAVKATAQLALSLCIAHWLSGKDTDFEPRGAGLDACQDFFYTN